MKKLSLIFLVLFSSQVYAAALAESAHKRSEFSAYGNTGFSQGGLHLGGDLEYGFKKTWSLGAFGRFYPEYKVSNTVVRNGLLSFGGFVRVHFFKREWDFYASPGFGVQMVEMGSKDETGFGPSLALGMQYQLTKSISIGMENMRHYGWFIGERARGGLLDEMSLNFKVSL